MHFSQGLRLLTTMEPVIDTRFLQVYWLDFIALGLAYDWDSDTLIVMIGPIGISIGRFDT